MSSSGGRVFLVGAGPGDPDLLTVRAARLVAEADDLVVDALVDPAVYRGSRARVIYVGKRAGRPHVSQARIGEILVELALRGRRVVRLKGGDPAVFARLAEEMEALEAAGVAYELVPGVSSVQAAALAAGLPLTARDVADRFVVMTGHRRAGGRPALPAWDPEATLVWLMPRRHLDELVECALAAGYPASLPAVAVSHASLADERKVACRLVELEETVSKAGLETPLTVLIGRVGERALTAARQLARPERVESGA